MRILVAFTSLAFAWLAFAGVVARADSFALDDVTIAGGETTYRAKRLEVTDTPLSREAMLALLGDDKTPAPERFAKLSAARITTPELVSTAGAGEVSQTVAYRDVVLEEIVAGRVARAKASGATFTIKGPQTGEIAGRAGALAFEGIDLLALAHILVEGRKAADEEARTVLGAGTIESFDVDLPSGGKGHVGRIVIRDAGARALVVPASSLVDLAPKPDAAPPSPERRRALSGVLADLLTSQSLGALDLSDVRIESGRATGVVVSVKTFGLSGVARGRIARTSLEGLTVAGEKDASASVGHLAFIGIDLAPLLAGAISDEPPARVPLRFDRIELEALAARVPNVGQPVALSLGRAALDAKDWRAITPQSLVLGVEHLAFDLPTDDPRARPLLDLGYKRLDLSLAAQAAYDAAKTELLVDRLSLTAPDVGHVALAARASNIGPDLLGSDAEKARAALAAGLFKHADILVSDDGLLTRLIATQARQTRTNETDVRARWASNVRAFVNALLADNADRNAVADVAERFIRSGGRVSLSADAPNGLGLIDAMLAGGAQGLLGKIKLTVGQ